ncbi:MAG TPA: hypothetical protein VHT73_19765 [Thermodesulfobacteriota bacterium]|nr:hypothetical protein [Thermodesulfobacteriota bacterium]
MNKELPIIKEGVEELKHMLKREQIVGRSSVYKLFIFYKADRDQMVEKLLFFWVCIVIQLDVGSEIMNREV